MNNKDMHNIPKKHDENMQGNQNPEKALQNSNPATGTQNKVNPSAADGKAVPQGERQKQTDVPASVKKASSTEASPEASQQNRQQAVPQGEDCTAPPKNGQQAAPQGEGYTASWQNEQQAAYRGENYTASQEESYDAYNGYQANYANTYGNYPPLNNQQYAGAPAGNYYAGAGVQTYGVYARPEPEVKVSRKDAVATVGSGIVLAILYSICFTGITVRPYFSLPFFTIGAVGLILVLLKVMGSFHNVKSLKFAALAVGLSIPSLIFGGNQFTFFNIVCIHLVIAAMVITARDKKAQNISNIAFLGNMGRTILASPRYGFGVIRSAGHTNMDKQRRKSILARIGIGVLISIPLLLIIIASLSYVDENFARMMRGIYLMLLEIFTIRFIGHLCVVVLAAIYFISYFQKARQTEYTHAPRASETKADFIICSTILILLNVVFFLFCLSQFWQMFGGGQMTLAQSGISVASFVREGFFQLLFVTVINFAIVLIMTRLLHNMAAKTAIRVLLVALCIFTAGLIISSFMRLNYYIVNHGFTQLRLLVGAFLIMESILIVMTIFGIIAPRFNLVKIYIPIMASFYLIANVVGASPVVTWANIQYYEATSGAYSPVHYFQETLVYTNLGMVIEFYEGLDENDPQDHEIREELKEVIENSIPIWKQNEYYRNDTIWQSSSVFSNHTNKMVGWYEDTYGDVQ